MLLLKLSPPSAMNSSIMPKPDPNTVGSTKICRYSSSKGGVIGPRFLRTRCLMVLAIRSPTEAAN